jgi:CSLREA domain-containing protein
MRLLRATVFVVIVASTAVPAAAATYVENDNANSSDSTVGIGVCRTSGGVCTLRAAIQEANATSALDTITFAIGTGPQRISLSSSLPAITQPAIAQPAGTTTSKAAVNVRTAMNVNGDTSEFSACTWVN